MTVPVASTLLPVLPVRRSPSPRRVSVALLATGSAAVVLVVGRGAVGHAWSELADVARVPSTPILLACAALISAHYVLLAAGVRFLAPVPLPWGEVLGVQMAAAVAGRFTPAGLGPATVNLRYLTRSGMSTPAALAQIGTMNVVGGLADVVAFTVLVCGGSLLGWSGLDVATHRSRVAAGDAAGRIVTSPLAWLVVALVAGALVVAHRISPTTARVVDRLRAVAQIGVAEARRRPAALLRFAFASAGTTVAFALVFTLLVADAAPGRQDLAALFVGYFVAAAAANAIPIPGGIGSTDALLLAAAVAAGAPFGAAAASIVMFRALTFWAPVPIGLGAGVWLRRRHCL